MVNGIKVIASLTSHPPRINGVGFTIFSLLKQSCKLDSIELNLSKVNFPNGYGDLPDVLNNLYDKGCLCINWVDGDTKTFKKLLPTVNKYYPEDYYVLTIDDDCIYLPNYVKKMVYELGDSDSYCPADSKVIGNRMIYRSTIFDSKFINTIIPDALIETYVDDMYIQCYLEHMNAKIKYGINQSIRSDIRAFNDVCPARNHYTTGNRIALAYKLSKAIWG